MSNTCWYFKGAYFQKLSNLLFFSCVHIFEGSSAVTWSRKILSTFLFLQLYLSIWTMKVLIYLNESKKVFKVRTFWGVRPVLRQVWEPESCDWRCVQAFSLWGQQFREVWDCLHNSTRFHTILWTTLRRWSRTEESNNWTLPPQDNGAVDSHHNINFAYQMFLELWNISVLNIWSCKIQRPSPAFSSTSWKWQVSVVDQDCVSENSRCEHRCLFLSQKFSNNGNVNEFMFCYITGSMRLS